MASCVPSSRSPGVDFRHVGVLARSSHPELFVSKQSLKKADVVAAIRLKWECRTQSLGFASWPFVLCGLPIRQRKAGVLIHERRNGHFHLQVTGHPSFGLPWGQDRLVPLFLATLAVRQKTQTITFRSAAEILDTFGMQQGGSQYRRLIAAFQRVFGATIFFGTETQRKASVFHQTRFSFMSEARIWYNRDLDQQTLPGDCQNTIVLSDEFYDEITNHPIPTDLESAKALSCAPAALDLFTWLTYRCYTADGPQHTPLFGELGLIHQLGSAEYSRPRKFREKLEGWLDVVRVLWPECPAKTSSDGLYLVIERAFAIRPSMPSI